MSNVVPLPQRRTPRLEVVSSTAGVAAALELGRLDQAVAASSLREIWIFRETMRCVASLVSSQSEHAVAPERLHAALAGLPLGAHRDYGALSAALALLADACQLWTPAHRGVYPDEFTRLRLWRAPEETIGETTPRRSALVRRVTRTRDHIEKSYDNRDGPLISELKALRAAYEDGLPGFQVRLAAPLTLMRYEVSRHCLPVIAEALADPLELSPQQWLKRSLERLPDYAVAARERLAAFDAYYARSRHKLGAPAKNSRLEDAFHIAVAMPVTTASVLLAAMRCTRQAASGYLRRLAGAGILREVSGRDRWRVYIPADQPDVARELTARSVLPPFSPDQEDASPPGLDPLSPPKPQRPIDFAAVDRQLAALIRNVDAAGRRVAETTRRMADQLDADRDDRF